MIADVFILTYIKFFSKDYILFACFYFYIFIYEVKKDILNKTICVYMVFMEVGFIFMG